MQRIQSACCSLAVYETPCSTLILAHVLQDADGDKERRFRDNDGLAALLAVELKADLLMLCTDVNGLYTGNPADPNSELIPTYSPEVC